MAKAVAAAEVQHLAVIRSVLVVAPAGGNMTGAGLATSGTTTGGGSAASRNLTTK